MFTLARTKVGDMPHMNSLFPLIRILPVIAMAGIAGTISTSATAQQATDAVAPEKRVDDQGGRCLADRDPLVPGADEPASCNQGLG